MPESELFNIVLQFGMFGLWAVFMWWVLTKGVPMIRDAMVEMGKSHEAVVRSINATATECARLTDAANVRMNETHIKAVDKMNDTHREVVNTLAKECREERMEMMDYVHTKLLPAAQKSGEHA